MILRYSDLNSSAFKKTVLGFLLLGLIATSAMSFCVPVLAQATGQPRLEAADSIVTETLRLDGLVVERQKYSFSIQTVDGVREVFVPNGTPVMMKLTRPKFDLEKRQVRLSLMLSSPDGNPANDIAFDYPLPEKTYVWAEFPDQESVDNLRNENVKELNKYFLTNSPPAISPNVFGGLLSDSKISGHFVVEEAGVLHKVKLGARNGMMSGFSILDLKPNRTSVFVQARRDGDQLIATNVRFEELGDATRFRNEGLPNVLTLGDIVSLNYRLPLLEALDGKANVYHPPGFIGPSKNWSRLIHHIGNLQDEKQRYDVIAFNLGFRDVGSSKEDYQSNLRNAVELLKQSKARLIWITSTPVPDGCPKPIAGTQPVGVVSGRMALQNEWASEVISDYPEILVCDLWEEVKRNTDGVFDHWWSEKSLGFHYAQSVPLGRKVATYILATVSTGESVNPMSVHQGPISGSANASR